MIILCFSRFPFRVACGVWTVYPDAVYDWTRRTRERDFVRQVGPTNTDRPGGKRGIEELFLVRALSFAEIPVPSFVVADWSVFAWC